MVKALRYQSDGPGIDSRVVSLGIFFRGTPDRTMSPEVDSASESEYHEFLLGSRWPVRLADDLPPL